MKRDISLLILCLIISVLCSSQIPAGYYYVADGKKKSELKSYLSAIISQAQMLNYGSGEGYTWQGFYFTDRNSDNSVVDMYSLVERFFPENYGSVSGMHIEHSLPKSWWGARQNNAYKDLFHLYPADGTTNITKNNLPLGEAASPSFNNGMTKIGTNGFSYYLGKVFEPADEFKGDFARSYLYMSTAYENFGMLGYWNSPMMNNNTYPVWQKWAIDLLLKWHRQDPVSQKEKTRQEAV
ncbi:MAG: endonuclease, partial [Prevotellaceae bacterium]|nr:endonuclease [Prevotellaceae bacterium]